MRKLFAVLALAALAVACTDQATAPDRQQTPAVSADFMNNPDNASPIVFREVQGPGWLWLAWDNDELTGGVTPWTAALMTNSVRCNGRYGVPTEMDVQRIDHSLLGADAPWQFHLQGEVYVSVYKVTGTASDWINGVLYNCNYRINTAVARGTAHWTQHDNSGSGYTPEWNRTNAWGANAQGDLTTVARGRAHFTYGYMQSFGADGWRLYHEKITYQEIGGH